MVKAYAGLDFGTSIIKATLIIPEKQKIFQVATNYNSFIEKSTLKGWSASFIRVFEKLLAKIDEPSFKIEVLSITGMVPNVALINENNKYLETILFYENTALDIEKELDKKLNSPKWANEVLSKVLKIKEKYKIDNFKWFTTHNWIVYELTGEYVIDSVTAGECGTMIDFETGNWNPNLENHDINICNLPQIKSPLTIVGRVKGTYQIEQLWGTNVIVGTSDTIATALGAGWVKGKTMLCYYGTFNSAAFIEKSRDAVLNNSKAYNPFNWILSVPLSGHQLDNLAKLIGNNDGKELENLDILAEKSPPGSNGLIFLHSENIDNTTISTRPEACIRNLQIFHTKSDLARSILESFGYLLKRAIKGEVKNNMVVETFISAGGGARSKVWLQIVSDICEITQNYIPEADRGLGSSILALMAEDVSLADKFMNEILKNKNVIIPNLEVNYSECYQNYINSFII